MDEVKISGPPTFDRDFPQVKVGARKHGRQQDDKDWWGVRRTLHALYAHKALTQGCRVRKIPETAICATPDFELCSELGFGAIEITEATHADDQREMTASEDVEGGHLVGDFGGRGEGGFGGNAPYEMVAEDVRAALKRKQNRYGAEARATTILGIYINSNPGFVISNLETLRSLLPAKEIDAVGFRGVVVFKDRDGAHLVYMRG